MTLSQELRNRLAGAPFRGSPQTIEVAGPFAGRECEPNGAVVSCAATAADSLSCALLSIEMRIADLRWSAAQVDRFAGLAGERIGHQFERLRAIEFDRRNGRLQMRSAAPRPLSADRAAYFELLACADANISIRRYAFDRRRSGRADVEFALTYDQLELVVDELAGIARELV